MKLLHLISRGNTIRWFWGMAQGRNGRPIAGGESHLYQAERGTPRHPITDNTNIYRRYWQAWSSSEPPHGTGRITPLCGRLRTASVNPRFYWTGGNWDRSIHCQNCISTALRRGIVAETYDTAVRDDPWNQLSYNERMVMLDPVSGL